MPHDAALTAKLPLACVGVLLWLIALLSPFVLFVLLASPSIGTPCVFAFVAILGIGTTAHQILTAVAVTRSFARAFAWASAVLLACVLVIPLATARPAGLIILLVIAIAVAAVFIGLRILKRATIARSFALVLGGATGLFALAGLALIPVVVKQAETLASGAPYCIQVANGTAEYSQAESLLELSGITMRASGFSGRSFAFHAVLVVEGNGTPSFFNWSYRRGGWLKYVSGPRPIVHCQARQQFARQLPTLFASAPSPNMAYFALRGAYLGDPVGLSTKGAQLQHSHADVLG
jgi:hypothetical protein